MSDYEKCRAMNPKAGTESSQDSEHRGKETFPADPYPHSYIVGTVRVELLSDSLIRIENATETGYFEDRASYIVQNRTDFPGTGSEIFRTDSETRIATQNYTVMIPHGGKAEDVSVTDAAGKCLYVWQGETSTNLYLPSPSDDLKCWYFTDSPRIIPSCDGYCDTGADDGQNWDFGSVATDIFVFLPRGSYRRFTEDFVNLTGRSEMVSLRTLGFWDSRYYAYSEETALAQIREYQKRGHAIDVLVIDTDWRKNSGTRGIGYDINTDLFPDMKRFLEECHEMGVAVCFNDHPEPVPGTKNGLDTAEVTYRNEKLKGLLSIGLDFWWYDRNWETSLVSCDPAVSVYAFGMYVFHRITEEYFRSVAEKGGYARRAVIMGNVDGVMHGEWKYASDLSAHRYPIQWTGDIAEGADDLAEEIYTAISGGAEVGIPYISSDLGGHLGTPTKEQYIRWIQYGMLMPVCRVHCWARDGSGRMPWLFGDKAEEVFTRYERLRYRLMPLFYLLARENYESGLPPVRRLDIAYPQYVESSRNDEYLLGDGILVAPLSEPETVGMDGNCVREVFLPDGTWLDVWTGNRYTGPVTVTVSHPIETSPLFVREGTCVVLARGGKNTAEYDWSEVTLDVYPSFDTPFRTRLYEDDTETVAYRDGAYRTTEISAKGDAAKRTVTVRIGAAVGNFDGVRAFGDRTWNVRVHKNPDCKDLTCVTVNGEVLLSDRIRRIEKSPDAAPFAYAGAAADGDVFEFRVGGAVDTPYEIGLTFERAVIHVPNPSYNKSATSFTLAAEGAVTEVDLSDGTLGFVSYGDGGSISAVGNTELFSYPRTRVCGSGKPKEQSTVSVGPMVGMVKKTYRTGNGRYSGNEAICTDRFFDFEIRTVGKDARYELILGGVFSTAKVTVHDRAGTVQTVTFGNPGGEWSQRVGIRVPKTATGTLYVRVASVTTGRDPSTEYPAATRRRHPAVLKLYGCYAEELNS